MRSRMSITSITAAAAVVGTKSITRNITTLKVMEEGEGAGTIILKAMEEGEEVDITLKAMGEEEEGAGDMDLGVYQADSSII